MNYRRVKRKNKLLKALVYLKIFLMKKVEYKLKCQGKLPQMNSEAIAVKNGLINKNYKNKINYLSFKILKSIQN